MSYKDLAELVRASRVERGLMTSAALYKQLGVAPKTLRAIEEGAGPMPARTTLLKLDRFFGWELGSAERTILTGLSPSVVGSDTDNKGADPMFLNLPDDIIAELSETEILEARAAAQMAFLAKAREIRNAKQA